MHVKQFVMQNAFLAAQHSGVFSGLLGKLFDFIAIFKLFLKGNVEDILATGLILRNLDFSFSVRNIDFCNTPNAKTLILKSTAKLD